MRNKNGRLIYFKKICASILIIVGIVICAILLPNHSKNQIPKDNDLSNGSVKYDSDYLIQFDNQCTKMSEDQLIRCKSQCEEVLDDIHSSLKSDSLNPEERHETLLSKNIIEQELKIVKKHLQIQN